MEILQILWTMKSTEPFSRVLLFHLAGGLAWTPSRATSIPSLLPSGHRLLQTATKARLPVRSSKRGGSYPRPTSMRLSLQREADRGESIVRAHQCVPGSQTQAASTGSQRFSTVILCRQTRHNGKPAEHEPGPPSRVCIVQYDLHRPSPSPNPRHKSLRWSRPSVKKKLNCRIYR